MQAAARAPQNLGTHKSSRTDVNSRDNLLLMATGRFCARENYDRLSMSQYREAFYLLAEHVTDDTKKKLGRFLAKHESTPRQVALYLALEPLNISTPMLRNSPALGQLDMLRIVELKGKEYAAELATRPDLGTNLVRRLRKMNSLEIENALQSNYAVHTLSREQDADIHFADATTQVSEVNYKGEEVTSSASDQISPQTLQDKTGQTRTEASLLEAAARGGRIETTEATTSTERSIEVPGNLGEALEHAARAGDRQTMIDSIHHGAGLTLQTTLSIIEDQSGDTLAVLLSANSVSDAQANRILMLTFPQIGLSTQNARRAVNFYAQLNSDSSREAVNQWPKATNHKPQHQTYLQDTDSNRLQRTPTTHTQAVKTTEQERKTG